MRLRKHIAWFAGVAGAASGAHAQRLPPGIGGTEVNLYARLLSMIDTRQLDTNRDFDGARKRARSKHNGPVTARRGQAASPSAAWDKAISASESSVRSLGCVLRNCAYARARWCTRSY